MKLTAKSRYGVRAIFDIAYYGEGRPVPIKDITERQRINPRYLEQIFQKLKEAGILGSKRGPRGGYYLLKEPNEITVYDIITGAEGPIELVFCVGEGEDGEDCDAQCDARDECPASSLWNEVGGRIAEIFRQTTIQDLYRRAEALGIERRHDAPLIFGSSGE